MFNPDQLPGTFGGLLAGCLAALGVKRVGDQRRDSRLTWLENGVTALLSASLIQMQAAGQHEEVRRLVAVLATAPQVRS